MSRPVMELCFDIKGQTGIVTGASSGLGVTFTETLAETGVNLVIAARRYEKLVEVAEDLSSKYGVEVIPFKTDVSQEKQVINMVKTDDICRRRVNSTLKKLFSIFSNY